MPVAVFAGFAMLSLWAVDGANTSIRAEDQSAGSSTAKALISHGKYLVHHVAKCIECHTPRDARGQIIDSRLLTGAPIPVTGPQYAQPWAAQSASIAGLGNYGDAYVRHLLTHGERPDGSFPASPMPKFNLTEEDADAMIAYLRSL